MPRLDGVHYLGLEVARKLVAAAEEEWPDIFHQLRSEEKLSVAVHQMNGLLADPSYRPLVEAAFRRIGLEYPG